jgi:hypothetical protein
MLIKATLPVMKNIQDGLGKLDHRIYGIFSSRGRNAAKPHFFPYY